MVINCWVFVLPAAFCSPLIARRKEEIHALPIPAHLFCLWVSLPLCTISQAVPFVKRGAGDFSGWSVLGESIKWMAWWVGLSYNAFLRSTGVSTQPHTRDYIKIQWLLLNCILGQGLSKRVVSMWPGKVRRECRRLPGALKKSSRGSYFDHFSLVSTLFNSWPLVFAGTINNWNSGCWIHGYRGFLHFNLTEIWVFYNWNNLHCYCFVFVLFLWQSLLHLYFLLLSMWLQSPL